MTDTPKHTRKRRSADDLGSKTKQKGAPVVGRQAETLFNGPRGNKPGTNTATQLLRVANAEIAARLSNTFLSSLEQITQEALDRGAPAAALESLTANTLNLMRDAMDREYGKAVGSMDITSNGETVGPQTIRLIAATKEDDGSAD